MSRSARYLLSFGLSMIFILGGTSAHAEVSINPEVKALEKAIENKINSAVHTFYGEDAKIVVNLLLKEQTPTETAPAEPQKEMEIDFGYLQVPFDPSRFGNTANTGANRLSVVSAEAEIQVSEDTPEGVVDGVKAIVDRALKGIPAKTSVARVNIPSRTLASENPTDPTSPEGLANSAKEIGFKDLIPLISAIGAAALLSLGIFLIAGAVRSATSTLTEGFRSIKASTQTSSDKPVILEHRGNGLGGGDGKPSKPPVPSTALKDYQRNVQIIKQVLMDNPMFFIQAIQESDGDLQGIKWLLPALNEEEQLAMKRYLGVERVARLGNENEGEPVSDYPGWLQGFVERIMLKRVQGGSFIDKALGTEKTMRFFTADPDQLIPIMIESEDRGAWRLVSEFLSRNAIEKAIEGLDDSKWRLLISSADSTVEEIQSAADRLLERMDQQGTPTENAQDRTEFFSRTLLDPVVSIIVTKNPGEDDLFLDSLETMSPDFVTAIKNRIWTPRHLDRVPDDYLAKTLKSLNNLQRVSLILALPESTSKRLESLLPEGNSRTIVADQVKKARAKADVAEMKNAVAVVREFLDYLRRQEQAGKLTLSKTDETKNEPAQSVTPEVPPDSTSEAA